MNGNQQMEYYVPSWKKNRAGKYYYVKVYNPIDSLKGELFIDYPTNKSGKKKFEEFPIFKNTEEAYVFYDIPKIKDSVYARSELHIKLHPFELDSLNTISSRHVDFSGTVFTNGIFPDFEYSVKVNKDYSLGFVFETEEKGKELYGKGVFKDEITLDLKGLNGRGRINYLSSNFESENISFYPDTLISTASFFNVDHTNTKELSTPNVSIDSVYVHWSPEADSMAVSMLYKPFIMYDSILTNDGTLTFKDKILTGSGNVTFETAELECAKYNFYADYFDGDNLEFDLRENIDSEFKFGISNAYGKVDLKNRKGHFLLKEDNASVEFIANKYEAYINNIVWNIDDKTIDLKSTNIDQVPWFVSHDPSMDSLRFQAKLATYSLVTDEINASYLEGIQVADAMIYPDSLKLVIMENGWMEGFNNAEIKIGVGGNEHLLKNANIEIESSRRYFGSAEYSYVDVDNIETILQISDLHVDSLSNISIAKGEILSDDDFMLNPYFSFDGEVEISSKSKFIRFKGYSGIQNYCDDIETGEIPIYDFIDPLHVKAKITNFDNLSRYSTIYNGLYHDGRSFAAAFLSTDKNIIAKNFISAKGKIRYDEPEACYVIGGDTINSILQNEVRYFNDECRLEASGLFELNSPNQIIDLKAFGDITYDMNSRVMKPELVLGISFPFNQEVIDAIIGELQLSGSKGIMENESELQKRAFARFQSKPISSNTDESSLGFGGEVPVKVKSTMLFSDLNLEWDPELGIFISNQELSLHNFDGQLINKIFNGRIELKKRKGGDEYTVYILTQEGKYFYFRYRNNVLDFFTNNKDVMKVFDEIEEKERNLIINGKKYRFKKASRLKVKTFQKKYT